MRSTTFQLRPALIPTLVMALCVPLFIALGLWQIERAQQKTVLATQQETRRKLPALKLAPDGQRFEAIEFRKVEVTGKLLKQKQILIENRKHHGKNGYHIITPLQIERSNRYILVNRGWRANQPQAAEPLVDKIVTIVGHAVIPKAPALDLSKAPADANTTSWPYLTLDKYQAWSGLNIYPFLLLQSPGDENGFIRQWPQQRFSDAMHIGYAIQWFAFALIALVVWFKLSLLPQKNQELTS